MRSESRLDRHRRVQIHPERGPPKARHQVLERDGRANPPSLAWIYRPEDAPRLLGRTRDHRGHVGIATNDAIERDDIRRGNTVCNLDEVAVNESDAVRVTAPRRFIARDGDVAARSIEVNGSAHAGVEKDMVNRPDAAADVEQRVAFEQVGSQLFDQAMRVRERTAPRNSPKLLLGFPAIELALDAFTLSA